MNISWKMLLSGIAVLLTSLGSGAHAFPGLGANCSSCHATPGGAFNASPNLLNVMLGGTGNLNFDVTSIPAGANAALGVVGLSASGLMATPGVGWTPRSNATDNWITSSTFNATQSYPLQLNVPANAVLGNYTITARLAGTDAWSTTQTFNVNVIPEPATLALLTITVVPLGLLAKRRMRFRRADNDRTGTRDSS